MSDAAQRQHQIVRIQGLQALGYELIATAEHASMKAWIQQAIDDLKAVKDSLEEPNASDGPRTPVDTVLDAVAHTLAEAHEGLATHGSDAEVLDDE